MSIDYTEHKQVFAAFVYDEFMKGMGCVLASGFDDADGKLVIFFNWTYIGAQYNNIGYSDDLSNPFKLTKYLNSQTKTRLSENICSGEVGEPLFVNPNQIRFIKRITSEQAAFMISGNSPD